MHLMLYLSGQAAVMTALIGILSRRLGRDDASDRLPPAWSYFWACTCIFHLAGAAYFGFNQNGYWIRWIQVAAAVCTPGAIWMAAWQRNLGKPGIAAWLLSAACVLAATFGFFVLAAIGGGPGSLTPLVPAVWLSSAGMGWFAIGLVRGGAERRDAGRFLLLAGTGGYAILGIGLGIRLLSHYSYDHPPVAGAAIDVVLVTLILSGLLLGMFRAAGLGYERLSALWEAAGAGLRLCERDGRILSVNPAFCRLVGKTASQLEGQPLSESYSPESGARIASEFRRRLLQGELPSSYTAEVELSDGRKVWLELRNSIVDRIEGSPVLTAAIDVTAAKTAEAALLRREQQLEVLSHAARTIHAALDADLVMSAVVDTACRLTGASRGDYRLRGEDTAGRPSAPAHPPGRCPAEAPGAFSPVVFNEPETADRALPCNPGDPVRNAVCVPVKRRDGKLLACFEVHDTASGRPFDAQDLLMLNALAVNAAVALENAATVEERRRAEERLARSEERYRSIVEGSPMGMHFYSLENGRLIFRGANRAADRLLHVAHAPLEGLDIDAAFPELAHSGVGANWVSVAAGTAEGGTGELSIRGGTFELHAFPTNPGSLAVTFLDLTERRQSEQARRATDERYRLITENSTDMISMHAPDGRFTFASPAFHTVLGYEPGQLDGRDPCAILHPEDRTAVRAAHAQIMRSGTADVTYRLRRSDGTWVWVESTSRAIRDLRTGELREMVNITRDISARRELEAQLVQSQKIESVGRLAGGVAHDFNNLLTVINGYAAMLTAEMEESDPRRESVAEIATAGARAAGLTRQLLAFSRKQVMRTQMIDLNQVISGTERILRRTIGADIDLRLVSGIRPAQVKADPGQIEQVLLNLAINARDAMPFGGILTFETARAAESADNSGGASIVLTVTDTGTGMTEEVRTRIFEPFFTTKESGSGTGLGLATVFGIVTQSGGRIEVESAPGQGSTFRIRLPEADGVGPAPASQSRVAARGGSETILLAEDQDEVRRMTQRILESLGYRVLAAAGPGEALQVCAAHPEEIHLLLTDIVMPEINGLKLAEKLLQMRPGIAVAFMSGYAETAMPGKAPDPRVRYLHKPFTPDELAVWVRNTLAAAACGTVLVVDDDEGVRKLICRILESAGFRTAEAANGREALETVGKLPVGLVVTDVVMPEKEGLETIRDLKRRYPSIPVIAVSGAFDGRFLSLAEAAGAGATLRKPVAADTLLPVVRTALEGQSRPGAMP